MTTGSPSSQRHLFGLLLSNVLGILAYSVLTPVIVLYAALVLGVLAFGLIGGGVAVDGSPVQNVVLAALAIGDGAWVEWVWRRDLGFEQNALRLFGGLGVLLWIGEAIVTRLRGDRPVVSVPLFRRIKRTFVRLGLVTLGLVTVLAASVVIAQAREAEMTPGWILKALATAYGMGLAVFLFSAPTLVFSLLLDAARAPLTAMVAGGGGTGGPGGAHPYGRSEPELTSPPSGRMRDGP